MLFENKTKEAVKARISEGEEAKKGFRWVTVKPGDKIDLLAGYGENLGFVPVEGEEPAADDELDEAPEDDGTDEVSFEDELQAIDGIGKATVKDIVKVYPDKASLEKAVKEGVEIPFRDDVVVKLKERFKAEETPEGEETAEE